MPKRTAIDQVRKACMALPEAEEKPFGGHAAPSFRVRDKFFAMTSEDGQSLTLKVPPGVSGSWSATIRAVLPARPMLQVVDPNAPAHPRTRRHQPRKTLPTTRSASWRAMKCLPFQPDRQRCYGVNHFEAARQPRCAQPSGSRRRAATQRLLLSTTGRAQPAILRDVA